MCGIYGYNGSSQNAADIVLSGLKSLDYRGYDSWGIAVLKDHQIFIQKDIGKIENINQLNFSKSNLSLGHTRWATTGSVSKINAHPHFSTDKSFALVQNGIVENYLKLKSDLIKKGYKFESETDTEVIVRLIEKYQKETKNLLTAVKKAFLDLEGRNTIALLDSINHQIIAVRNGSPLIIGQKDGDYFISSDTVSLGKNISTYYDLDNFELVVLNSHPQIINLKTNKNLSLKFKKADFQTIIVNKGDYKHFMIKEIFETPLVIKEVINTDKNNLKKLAQAIKKAKTIYTIGSGTAGNAAAQIAYFLREIAHIQTISLVGADALEYYKFFTKDDLIIAPSQSGETADVLEVLEYAKTKKMTIVSYVNMPGSMMTRLSDFKFIANAGPEICVMSTKIFTSQIAWGYLLAKTIAKNYQDAIENLKQLVNSTEKYLRNKNNHTDIKKIAQKLLNIHDIFLLGKSQNFQIAKEGMIKIIEGTYKHAHAIPAGDLKHYAITLIEKDIYTIAVLSQDQTINDMNNAINEIRSRGGSIIGVYSHKQDNFDYLLKTPSLGETSSIFNIIPLQLLTYYLSLKLGNNIDKPRNIAKSVTVK
ncbi:MAG: glutamine--fructose-6-phosphate transaminase (isomerizing) [Candidatus Shapirobacteria bacterium]|nr:glutamine--fructose-6-phosphate transaminase (isomerizing) [Candidatus Shapirobacteria bacterium]